MINNNNILIKLFLFSLIFRLLNSISIKSFFQPDEYWQSLEISHSLIFSYGYKTWEWRALGLSGGIRSPLYPYLFLPVYKLLNYFQLDQTSLLTLAPRLLQGCFASLCDLSTWLLTIKLLGPIYANVALLCSLTSFFHAYALTRTFSNSMETILTTIALALWPWSGLDFIPSSSTVSKELKDNINSLDYPQYTSLSAALALASLATIMRPSNAIIWIVLGIHLLYSNKSSPSRFYIINTGLIITICSLSFCYYLDTSFYYRPTFTPYNFLVQNVYNSIALFYGQNPFHFYLTQALPVTTFLLLPFVLHGWCLSRNHSKIKVVNWTVGITTLVYSCLGHKEFRFVHPLLPLLHIIASYSLVHLYNSSSSSSSSPTTPTSSPKVTLPIKPLHFFLLILNLIPAIYLNTYHSRAQIQILETLRRLPTSELKSVAFLMPCHSTPWMSHLHRKDLMEAERYSGEGGKSWFLTCEPPVLGQNPSTYLDQSDYFYQNPSLYLLTRFPPSVNPAFPPSPFPALYSPKAFDNDLGWKHTWPSHLVVFQDLLDTKNLLVVGEGEGEGGEGTVGSLLEGKGYREVERLWNSHWHDDDRRRGDIVLLRWMP